MAVRERAAGVAAQVGSEKVESSARVARVQLLREAQQHHLRTVSVALHVSVSVRAGPYA